MLTEEGAAMRVYLSGEIHTDWRDEVVAGCAGLDVEALTLVNAAAGADKALIERVSVFDEFKGDKAEAQMGAGKKSLAISVRLQPTDKTLTDADIEAVATKVIEKVSKATGGVLRG